MNSKLSILTKTAFKKDLQAIVEYIEKDSPQNAIKFADDLLPFLDKIIAHPTATSIVRQIPTKKNWYRYKIYKKNYKVIFKLLKSKLVFLGIIHTSRHLDNIAKMRTSDYS